MHQMTHLESKEREVLKDTAACEHEQDAKQTLHEQSSKWFWWGNHGLFMTFPY